MTGGLLGGRPRRTLAAETGILEGVGLHSGADASVRVRPAAPGSGLRFLRTQTGQEIPATLANVTDTQRCTVLAASGTALQTVEHLLSALAALGVDDAVIEVSGPEVPAMDGSARPFFDAFARAGLRDQPESIAEPLTLARPVSVSGPGGAQIVAFPADAFRATVLLEYPEHPFLGTQAVRFDAATGDYAAEIAPARTYGFLRELEWLRAHGLGLGASLDNALALRDDGYENPPRFPDELARHKLLDLIGDLALLGRPLAMEVVAVRPGHALNAALAGRLREETGE